MINKKTKIINKNYCLACDDELTYNEVMYSRGRCPKCGFKHPEAGTIVAIDVVAYKHEYDYPWYYFWKKPRITKI